MRRIPILAAALALVLLACSDLEDPGSTPSPANATGEALSPTVVPGAVATATAPGGSTAATAYDNERALEHARVLSVEIGPRVAGSEAEREAAAYIRDQLQASGYTVEVQEFTFRGNRFPLSTIITGETAFEGYALQGSGGGTASGPAVYIGLGQESDIEGLQLSGAVAVAERGVIPFRVKYMNARAAGAVALVVINNEPGPLINGRLDAFGAFPVVGAAQEDGDALRMAAEAGLELTVTAPPGDEGHALNVLARAANDASCDLLVGGHHDTVPSAPGANDNASGVAHVIELARAMAADGLDEGLCFATFGAEESGLFGSKELVARLGAEGPLPRVMLNLDVTGSGNDVEAIGTARLQQVAVETGAALGISTRAAVLPPNTGSDHSSFQDAGAEVIFLSSGGFARMHSPGDTFEQLEPAVLDRVGRVAFALLTTLYEEVARG